MISDTRNTWGYSVGQRRTRRRIVAAYWLAVAILVAGFLRHSIVHHGFSVDSSTAIVLMCLPAILGGVRAGGAVKPFRGVFWVPLQEREDMIRLFNPSQPVIVQDASLDEREKRLRDRVHFLAYTLARWFALLLFALYALLGLWNQDWLALAGPALFFLLVLTLWSLPQSLILWNEPDMEDAQ